MKKAGFTLVELLVVIAIIGLLASIVLVSLGGARSKAKDARRLSDMKQITLAMEMCYDDANCGNQGYVATDSCTTAGVPLSWTKIGPASTNTTFLIMPKDPVNNTTYAYKCSMSTAKAYCFFAKLEAPASTTFICASNKGTAQYASGTSYTPLDSNCCGLDLTK